jgi:hypothetical protein
MKRASIIAVCIAIVVSCFPAFPQKWSSECEEQFQADVQWECDNTPMKCKEQDEGR